MTTSEPDRVTREDLQALSRDEQASILFFLMGYMEKSEKFQEALTAAYGSQLEIRALVAERLRNRDQ